MNEAPQINSGELPDAIQDLRDEIQRDYRGRGSVAERRPNQKPGVSLLAVVASALGSLFLGAFGMSLYDAETKTPLAATSPQLDVRADLEAVVSPHTQRLEELTQSLLSAQQLAAEDARARGLLLDHLAEQVASVQKAVEAQSEVFPEPVDLVAEHTADKLPGDPIASGQPTLAGRPPIPKGEAAVQPAAAEAELSEAEPDEPGPASGEPAVPAASVPETEVPETKVPETKVAKTEVPETDATRTAAEKAVAGTEKPAGPQTDQPETGELVIDNPSKFDLKLLVNGKLLDIKARGVTTIAVTVGTVKTQIASLPQVVQTWDQWETVEGVRRLTIDVDSGDDYYKLR